MPLPWWVLPALALVGMLIFAGVLVATCFSPNETLQAAMFGSAATLAGMGWQYFFGSSNGSRINAETLASQVKAASNPDPKP